MDNLPCIPKDYDKINNLIDKLSPYDLELLEKMDEHSQKWFFDTAKIRAEKYRLTREEINKQERLRFIKFFFTVALFCALAVLVPNLGIYFLLFPFSVVFNLICHFFGVLKSAYEKTNYSTKEFSINLFGLSEHEATGSMLLGTYKPKEEFNLIGTGLWIILLFIYCYNYLQLYIF